ncbi:MAG: FAD-dependent oxidoreductase [Thermoanaerobaculia bacterium]
MARTPLFRSLRRALALARAARASGESPTEIVERYRAERALGFSRRELLATGAAVGAGLALGCGKSERLARLVGRKQREVAVVGAGIAGLTCAYRLMQSNVPVRVYEAQDRIGGRMWSLREKFAEHQVCELGGELIDSGHEHLRGLAGELGLALDDFHADDPRLASDIWYFDGRRIPESEVVAAFQPVAEKIDAAWELIPGETITYREPNHGEEIDRQSLAEWLDGAECGGWFRHLLDVGYTTEFGREIAEQSAWNLLTMISTEGPSFEIFGESDERFHVRGGNDQVPARLGEKLGARIETGRVLQGLRADGDAYELAFGGAGGAKTVKADKVVLALPFTKLREVELGVALPEVKRRAIAELGYGTNAKLMIGFSDRLWRSEGGSNGSVLSDLPFQLTWESTRLQGGEAGILVVYTGGRRGVEIGAGTPAEQAEKATQQLERVFPGISSRRVGEARFHWPSFEWTKGSYACYLPGQWTTICGAEGERVGNLHFAGEHTSLAAQGYMEGGCESGDRAAAEILADLALPVPEGLRATS